MNELKGRRVLFFVPESNVQTNAVHASQVGALAKYIATLGAECLIFQAATTITERTYDIATGVHVLNDLRPRKKVLFWSVGALYEELASLYKEELMAFRPTHIYTRNHNTCIGAMPLAKATGAKLIFSVRGPAAEERIKGGGIKGLIAGLIEIIRENRAIRKCDILSTLSYSYERYLTEKYRREVIGVIPCCTTEAFFCQIPPVRRSQLRGEFGFNADNRVIVWSGSFAHWQQLDKVVEFLRNICEADNQYRVLFLLKKEREISAICHQFKFDEKYWRTKYCRKDEVSEYLQAADLGINFQDPKTLHSRTCSPIKIPEYLASGLPVLVTPVMGDMPEIVEREGVGGVLKEGTSISDTCALLDGLLRIDSKKSRDCSRRLFTWKGNKSEIVKLFS